MVTQAHGAARRISFTWGHEAPARYACRKCSKAVGDPTLPKDQRSLLSWQRIPNKLSMFLIKIKFFKGVNRINFQITEQNLIIS